MIRHLLIYNHIQNPIPRRSAVFNQNECVIDMCASEWRSALSCSVFGLFVCVSCVWKYQQPTLVHTRILEPRTASYVYVGDSCARALCAKAHKANAIAHKAREQRRPQRARINHFASPWLCCADGDTTHTQTITHTAQ